MCKRQALSTEFDAAPRQNRNGEKNRMEEGGSPLRVSWKCSDSVLVMLTRLGGLVFRQRAQRFCKIAEVIAGISHHRVSLRLWRLCRGGLLKRSICKHAVHEAQERHSREMFAVNESVSGIIHYMRKACSGVGGIDARKRATRSVASVPSPAFDCCCYGCADDDGCCNGSRSRPLAVCDSVVGVFHSSLVAPTESD